MRSWLWLAGFLLLTVGGGALIGSQTPPGDWYRALDKPWFNPPGWIFGPVWTLLYVLIGIAGWRVWCRPDGSRASGQAAAEARADAPLRPRAFWVGQLALNFAWSPIFFGAQQPAPALAVLVALVAAIVGFIATAWRYDRTAALLMLPYLAWVAFAGVLNGAIVMLN